MKMKLSFLIVLALISALKTEVVAQPTEKNQSNLTQVSGNSWTFLLETKTQWFFIFQGDHDTPVVSSSTTSSSIASPGLPREATEPPSQMAQTLNGNSSAKQDESKSSVDAPTDGFVFEGNTDDIPSDEPSKKPEEKPKPFNPSAPTS